VQKNQLNKIRNTYTDTLNMLPRSSEPSKWQQWQQQVAAAS